MREAYESHPTFKLISKRVPEVIDAFMNAMPDYQLTLNNKGDFNFPINPAVSKLLEQEFANLGFTESNEAEKILFIALLTAEIVKKIKLRFPKKYS